MSNLVTLTVCKLGSLCFSPLLFLSSARARLQYLRQKIALIY